MKSIIVTGDRPTGPLHLGHYVGSLQNRLNLQKTHDQFIVIADSQALTNNYSNPRVIRNNVMQVALDYLAVGLEPKENVIFIQSMVPELFELTSYLLNFVEFSSLEKNQTLIEESDGSLQSARAGFLTYPVSQAADILSLQADLVPVGDDQKPIIEQANEIARCFNKTFNTNLFKQATTLIGRVGKLPGVDGSLKMGKSNDNAIYLADTTETIMRKVNLMSSDTVICFLKVFEHDRLEIERIKTDLAEGKINELQIRKRLIVVLDTLLRPIRQKRYELSQNMDFVLDTCLRGTEIARYKIANTLNEVKKLIGFKYLK